MQTDDRITEAGTAADNEPQPIVTTSATTSATIEANPLLAAVYVGGQTPIERLRNKLTPFMNLAAMLYESDNLVMPFVEDNELGKQFNDLFENELERCKLNSDDIKKHLSDCEVFYNRC